MDKYFEVYAADDYGRPTYRMCIVSAKSKDEAILKASERFNNKEIVTTGFYGARVISMDEINKERLQLQKAIKMLNNII